MLLFVALTIIVGILGRGHKAYRTLQEGEIAYRLEVADTDATRARGLGGRAALAADQGMLFVYQPARQQCFWMKDTRFALDIIWLDDQQRVIHIASNAKPESYPNTFCPGQPASYVIELRAGEVARHTIELGDRLSF